MSAVFFAVILFLPQFFQKILGYGPLEAGAALLPMLGIVRARVVHRRPPLQPARCEDGRLRRRGLPRRGHVPALPFRPGLGLGLARAGDGVTGAGVGLFLSSITTAAVTALDPSRSSLAGGIVYMFQIAGGSIGLGLTTTVFTTASEDALQADLVGTRLSGREVDALHGALAGTDSANSLLTRFPAETANRLVELVREAFAAGMQWAFRLVALLALAGLVVSVLFVGGSLLGARRRPAAQPEAPA